MTLYRTLIPIACGFALAISGCGSSSATHSSSATTAASSTTTAAPSGPAASSVAGGATRVLIRGYAFHPGTVTVTPGAKVTFTNRDQTNHTATSNGGAFDTATIAPGASQTVVLTHPGTYTYICQFHAFMKATLMVK